MKNYVQTKKAVIIIIFLLTVIGALVYDEYIGNDSNLKILLVSPADNIVDYSLTKNVWDEVEGIDSSELSPLYSSKTTEYVEVQNATDLLGRRIGKVGSKDLVILIGNTYNDVVPELASRNHNTKFVLVESDLDNGRLGMDNVYKMNIDWRSYFEKILSDVASSKQDRIAYLIGSSEEDQTRYEKIVEVQKDNDRFENIEIEPIYMKGNSYKEDVTNLYNDGVNDFVSTEFDRQQELLNFLIALQKDNVYKVNKQTEELNSLELQKEKNNAGTSANNSSSGNSSDNASESTKTNAEIQKEIDDLKKKSKKFEKIRFYNVYESQRKEGEFDNILGNEVVTENISPYLFEINIRDELITIVLNGDSNKKISLSTKNDKLELVKIENRISSENLDDEMDDKVTTEEKTK